MYSGVPLIKPVCVIFRRLAESEIPGQAEVNHLDEVPFAAPPAEHDVARLDIAMNQSTIVSFGDRAEHLPEQSTAFAPC